MYDFIRNRRFTVIVCLSLCIGALSAALLAQEVSEETTILNFLNQTVSWYRQSTELEQVATEASDSIYLTDSRRSSKQVLQFVFQFARANAALMAPEQPAQADQPAPGTPNAQNMQKYYASVQARVKQTQLDIAKIQRELETATGRKRELLQSQLQEVQSELDFASAQAESLKSFVEFFASSGTNNGLLGEIQDLERVVPEARATTIEKEDKGSAASAKASETQTVARKSAPTGIIGLTADVFSLHSKLSAQQQAIDSSIALRQELSKLRTPLSAKLRENSKQGRDLSQAPDLTDEAAVKQRSEQLKTLTANFKKISAATVPMGKAAVLLDEYRSNMQEWRENTKHIYFVEIRSLVIRLTVLIVLIVAVLVISEFWRRATYRYVQDTRRRQQFMLLRRIAMTVTITMIVLFTLVTEVGTLATMAGFITAGLAVALQNVILSVAAYFLLIGKYGIRVGDRVQISGVTGDVIDIGLVRMHLMELDPHETEGHPTGRVVVFSNAVLFQPTANFFKQLPGTNFSWHRVTLTLSPKSDYKLAESRLMEAVNTVYAQYEQEMLNQYKKLERTVNVPLQPPQPQSNLRFRETGLEITIRYPVPLTNVASIDDQVARTLIDTLGKEPKLQLVGTGTPNIQPVTEPAR